MSAAIILSHFQLEPVIAMLGDVERVEISPDLGLSKVVGLVEEEGLRFPNGELLNWAFADQIMEATTKCFILEEGEIRSISAFSEETNRVYGLMPTEEAPTLLVSGIPMHRIKGITPNKDTREKIKAITPIQGQVLDTATGLGYTAIQASKTADLVTTIEFDPVVLEIAKLNPWSKDLFAATNIRQKLGDSFEMIQAFKPDQFTTVIHDPPTLSLAGDLYSSDFYLSVLRVLSSGGRFFHYIGNPESRSGKRQTEGVIRRLHQVGFSKIRRTPEAFGLVAQK